MNILITGATGFVGRHLIHHLRAGLSHLSGTYFPKPEGDPPDMDGVNLFYLDIRNAEAVRDMVAQTKPDRVFHLAALSNIRQSWEMRRDAIETNILGTFHLYDAIRDSAPAAKILFVSSSDVYGGIPVDGRPSKETDDVAALNPYALSKISGESLSRFYSEVEGLDIRIARSFPHTGPGQSRDFVCSDWAGQIADIERDCRRPVLHVGNLIVRRDYCDVRDVVRAYSLLMDRGKKGRIYNVCSGIIVSLKDILDILFSLSQRELKAETDPARLRRTDCLYLAGDPGRIREELGWTPEIPLSQTLSDILNYWRQIG
ncbi:MAG: GDP-mannose 4,6-dehydratase [Candidatus Aminicenantes bacterium]|nr:GDP-mannose 4,6-dehydratase [Candidatus Aminicenantes bacterium]